MFCSVASVYLKHVRLNFSSFSWSMRCWLCEYSDDPVARSLVRFMADQSATMEPELMAERVHEALVEKCPMAEGIGLDEVRDHILSHTLCPRVRVAGMLRSVMKLIDRLEPHLTTVDADTGQVLVEAKNVGAYLKGMSEAMQMYRAGEASRLLFSHDGKT